MANSTLHIALVLAVTCLVSGHGGAFAQTPGVIEIPRSQFPTPALGSVDPCAGTGAVGSNSYGACQLRQQILSRGVTRTPDLTGLDRAQQMRAERICASDQALGQSVHAACLRRELGVQGYDPNTPMRPLPPSQRDIGPQP